MRFTLRFKLFAIVGAAAIALILLTLTSGLADRSVESQLDSIRQTYLPRIRLRPQIETAFDHLDRAMQNAVEASDADLLASATGQRDTLMQVIEGAQDVVPAVERESLRSAIDDYMTTAIAVSKKLIAGTSGEALTTQVQDMQGKKAHVTALIEQATAFDERTLASAFEVTKDVQAAATRVRILVAAICLLVVLGISIWIGQAFFANLRALIAGFQRFGQNDFATPIASTTQDELSEVASQANVMARQLHTLDLERANSEWIRTGVAGLNDELREALEPKQVADRSLAYLARYLEAAVGALYHGPVGGPFQLLGGYALADRTVPAAFAAGEGLVGQAATREALTVIEPGADAPAEGLSLRSGLLDTRPRALVLKPLGRGAAITGVLELATIRPWQPRQAILLDLVGETIAIALQIAENRAASRELLVRTQNQAHALERTGESLQQKAEELARASAYKSQFLANMSHELRTPLNAIIGFSELMFDGAVPLDDDTKREYLGDVLSSGRHLLQLINDVLDLAKVEAGKLEFHPEQIALPQVVKEVLAVLKTVSAKQLIEVRVEIAKEVEQLVLDPARLKQVLYNYLSNALKFTPVRGRVTVRGVADGDDRVRIEVEDSGTGISAEDVAKLFTEFQQTQDGARKSGSTGLGLALTKQLVEAQGGRVGVRSELGKGSTFHAIFPRRAGTPSAQPNTLQAISAAAGAPTILVVEDEPLDRERLVEALVISGYAVEAVSTGKEAVARCAEREFAAITLDLLLPDMTGFEILERIRGGKNGNIPVIVVTVVAEPGAVAGFAVHDVLAKPLVEPELLASLLRAGVEARDERSIVLVVDDDPASLKVMSATLGRLGFLAVCEQDPIRGLRAATEQPPSAIVLDLLMPGMTGFEFLEQFRQSPSSRNVPVIVWTSKDLTADELALLRRSAHAIISKGHEGTARVLAELCAVVPISSARSA